MTLRLRIAHRLLELGILARRRHHHRRARLYATLSAYAMPTPPSATEAEARQIRWLRVGLLAVALAIVLLAALPATPPA